MIYTDGCGTQGKENAAQGGRTAVRPCSQWHRVQDNDSVQVVGHDNENVECNLGTKFGRTTPLVGHNLSTLTQAHFAVLYVPKQALSTVSAKSQEVRARP